MIGASICTCFKLLYTSYERKTMTVEQQVEQICYLFDLQQDRARSLSRVERALTDWPQKTLPEAITTEESRESYRRSLEHEAGRLRFAIDTTKQKLNNTWIYC